jgi:hypothetical protein
MWETLRWVLPLWPYPLSREHRGFRSVARRPESPSFLIPSSGCRELARRRIVQEYQKGGAICRRGGARRGAGFRPMNVSKLRSSTLRFSKKWCARRQCTEPALNLPFRYELTSRMAAQLRRNYRERISFQAFDCCNLRALHCSARA